MRKSPEKVFSNQSQEDRPGLGGYPSSQCSYHTEAGPGRVARLTVRTLPTRNQRNALSSNRLESKRPDEPAEPGSGATGRVLIERFIDQYGGLSLV